LRPRPPTAAIYNWGMDLRKAKATFSIVVGVSIMSLWGMLFITERIPELETEPINISFHIVSELLLAMALLASGVELFRKSKRADKYFLVAMGLLLYSVVNAAGYYGESSNWVMVGMFAGLFCGAVILVIGSVANHD
jgi:hypothetical protein